MEELLDVYDEYGVCTGRVVDRAHAFLHEGEFVLYVLAIVQDLQGRYLITQRSLDKSWAAGWWEVTGGGVRAGETSQQAVVREVREEVGLDVSKHPLETVFAYKNVEGEGKDNYIVDIYHFRVDADESDVRLQASEAIACKFATWEEIEQLAAEGLFLHFGRLRQALEAEGVL